MSKVLKKEPITSAKGMHDLLSDDLAYVERVIKETRRVAEFYGFVGIATPHVEKTELFERPLGEESDIVEKQMYSFRTRGGDRLTLRPEGTASIVRAYFEHGLQSHPQPVKLFYSGSFFRHENPQAGRLREFHQAGVEILGDEDAINDAIVIRIFISSLYALGIKDIMVNINTLGDKACRPAFRKELVNYYRKHFEKLCRDCKRRFKENPLRLLDCKEEMCAALKQNAPQMLDYACEACKKHFSEVLEFLDEIAIPYCLDSHLVRGLDYYSRTVFEVFPTESEGASPLALGGGGRYDDLAELLGSRRLPGIGFSMGVERVVDVMKKKGIRPKREERPKMFLIQLGPAAKKRSLVLIEELRKIGVPISQTLSKDNLRSQLNIVLKLEIPLAVILGQKEALDGTVALRNMDTGVQETLAFDKFIGTIKARLKEFS